MKTLKPGDIIVNTAAGHPWWRIRLTGRDSGVILESTDRSEIGHNTGYGCDTYEKTPNWVKDDVSVVVDLMKKYNEV